MSVPKVSTSSLSSPIQSTQVKTDHPPIDLFVILAIAHKDLIWANHHYHQGQFAKALTKFEVALGYYTQAQETTGMGQSLTGLSAVYLSLGQPARSLACSQAAVAILAETMATAEYALAVYQWGISHFELRHSCQAERCFKQALALFEALGDRTHQNRVLLHLGQLYAQQEKGWFALACYESVLASLLNHPTQENIQGLLRQVLSLMTQLCEQTKTGEAAIASFQRLLTQRIAADYSQPVADLIQQLGQFHESQQQYQLALECYAQALQTIPPVIVS
ncbi:MAG: tetratricopeptide repeat protein [Cyanobacteria bacterium P01_D01_bin.115]